MACGSAFWDWMVLDFAYGLVLMGGSMVLRARAASPMTWILFGLLSVAVGGFMFAATAVAQGDLQASQIATAAGTACR